MKRLTGLCVAVIALVACLVVVGCAQQGGSADNAITVSASGNAKVVPDKASIGISVKAEGTTEDDTRQNAERLTNEVIARLKTAGADESKITTTTSSLTPRYGVPEPTEETTGYYDWDGNWVETTVQQYYYDGMEQLIGYETTTTIQASDVDVSDLNTMLRESAAAGATGFSNFTYSISDRDAAYQAGLSAAVEAAHAKAEALASASNVYVGHVVNMVENSEASSLDLTVGGDTSKLDAKNVATLEVEPPEIPIEASVTVSYAIS